MHEDSLKKIKSSGLFDRKWYLKEYPDVSMSRMDPAYHFLKYGAMLGRDPSSRFSTRFYREKFLRKDGKENPLLHYLDKGKVEGYKYKPNALDLRDKIQQGDIRAANYLSRFCNKSVRELYPLILLVSQNEKISPRDLIGVYNNYLFDKSEMEKVSLSSSEKEFFLGIGSCPGYEVGGELVTVILPAYNAEKTITHSISSILNQTWKNLKLIIVDDCSSDSTFSLAKSFEKKDGRVKVIKNKKNVGPYVSKNIAMAYAEGKYVTGQDADDWSHPQRLEKHIAYAKRDGAKASMAYMFRVKIDGNIELRREGVLIGSSISTLYDLNFMRKRLGYWDCAKFGADSELIARATLVLGSGFKYYRFPSMICLAAPGSLTSNPDYGVSVEGGLSPARISYRESWATWHKKIKPEETFLPFPHKERKFYIPEMAKVSMENIEENLTAS